MSKSFKNIQNCQHLFNKLKYLFLFLFLYSLHGADTITVHFWEIYDWRVVITKSLWLHHSISLWLGVFNSSFNRGKAERGRNKGERSRTGRQMIKVQLPLSLNFLSYLNYPLVAESEISIWLSKIMDISINTK